MLVSLSCFDLAEFFTVLFRDTDFHLRQVSFLLMQISAENFLFSIHIIVSIEVNRLSASGCIEQVLLHALIRELLALLLRQIFRSATATVNSTPELLESLAGTDDT